MAFKLPWSKKKNEPRQQAALQPSPAQEAPQPAAVVSLSDEIRAALEHEADRIIATPAADPAQAEKIALGMRLQDLKRAVDDAPCTFPDFDSVLLRAIGQLSFICKTVRPEQLAGMIDKLEGAIAARASTEESTPKYKPTMQAHYYRLILIEMQGRLNALLESKRRKEAFIQRAKAMPANERIGYRETIQAFTMELEDTELALMTLHKQIALCKGGLEVAETALLDSGEMSVLDAASVLEDIYNRSRHIRTEYESMEKAANQYQIMHQAQVEEQMVAVSRFTATRAEQDRIAAETETMADAVRSQMAALTGLAHGDTAAPMEADAIPEAAAQEVPAMPEMPDLFADDFAPMSL